ncbi:MAG: cell division topological specificity factor MinE [Christensenellales bacterium]|jgi:septum formation topological specificity factor MinE
MKSIFSRLIRRNASSQIARQRLKAVILSERGDACGALEHFKPALAGVFAQNFEMDPQKMALKLRWQGRKLSLVAEMPIDNIGQMFKNVM